MPPAPEDSPRPKLRGRKQLLLKLGVFLLLGAIINVAVAWGIAVVPKSTRGFERVTRSKPQTFAWIGPSDVTISQSSGVDNNFWADEGPTPIDDSAYRRIVPIGSVFADGDPVNTLLCDNLMVKVHERMVGWPLLAFAHTNVTRFKTIDAFTVQDNGLRLPVGWSMRKGNNNSGEVLPFLPLWPGFAINTVFYAALLWVLWIAPGKIRRFIRVRGHRCSACGYKIDSAPGIGPRCSECGYLLGSGFRG